MDLIIRPSSNDTIAIALGGKLKGIKVKNSWIDFLSIKSESEQGEEIQFNL